MLIEDAIKAMVDLKLHYDSCCCHCSCLAAAGIMLIEDARPSLICSCTPAGCQAAYNCWHCSWLAAAGICLIEDATNAILDLKLHSAL
jgi:hypothetical protein